MRRAKRAPGGVRGRLAHLAAQRDQLTDAPLVARGRHGDQHDARHPGDHAVPGGQKGSLLVKFHWCSLGPRWVCGLLWNIRTGLGWR